MAYDLSPVQGTPAYSSTAKFGDQSKAGGWVAGPAAASDPSSAIISGTAYSAATFEAWVNHAAATALEVFLGRLDFFWVAARPDGTLSAVFGAGAGINGNATTINTTAQVCDGNWHHIALVLNASSAGGAVLYVDGAVAGSSTASQVAGTSANDLTIGNLGPTGAYAWNGLIDEVAVSNVAQYSAAFTPPVAAFATGRAGQIARYSFDASAPLANTNASTATPPPVVIAILPNDPDILYSPANWDVTAARAKTINSGAYFRALLTGLGSNVTLNFDVSALGAPLPELAITIDGISTVVLIAAQVVVPVPGTTTWGDHILEVVVKSASSNVSRWSPQATATVFQGISGPGSTARLPRAASHRIAVIGDSITEGIFSLGTSVFAENDRSDSRFGWAWMQRHLCGAEVGVIGFSGTGLTQGGAGGVPAVGQSAGLQWGGGPARSFAGLDAIVINEGTNDGGNDITALYASLLNTLLASFSGRIFAMLPFNGTHGSQIQAAIAACAVPGRCTYVDTTGWFNPADSNDGVHPYGYTNAADIAPRLAAVINGTLAGVQNRWTHS